MDKKDKSVDGLLVVEYQSGNSNAMAKLVERYHKTFCEKAFWIVKDADIAKDVAQESWKTIMEKLNNIKDPNSFGSWASRIVCNKAMDVLRLNSKILKYKQDYGKEVDQVIETHVVNEGIKTELLNAIKGLPIKQQHVIKLFYVEEYALKEIAEMLNISVGTTKSRLFHAREKLKQILKQYNYEN